ncbi:hypothetical protein BGZ88_011402 [Linnemannia elongata]|nr:hypothetical protein BGZ88_011402 [Linnemannia elongata]
MDSKISWLKSPMIDTAEKTSLFGLPVIGFDRLTDGTAEMRYSLFGYIPLVNVSGLDLFQSAFGRLVSELVFVPAAALDPSVTWQPINDRTVIAVVAHAGQTHDVQLTKNPPGALASVTVPRWAKIGNVNKKNPVPQHRSTAQPTSLANFPELVSLIGHHLDRHDLTTCVRVCRSWFDAFTPLLYHTVVVYDFDLYSTKFDVPPYRAQRSTKNAHLASSDDDPGYGGGMVHKYGHLVHSITSSNIRALAYLGDHAVNLTHVVLHPCFSSPAMFGTVIADTREQKAWGRLCGRFEDRELIISTWIALINRNPGLKSVRINLDSCDMGTERIIHALAKCEHLEEVYLESMTEANTLEMMLDHCPHILSLSATCGQRATYVLRADQQMLKAEYPAAVGVPTKIRHFNITTDKAWNFNDCTLQLWIIQVLRRCPDLQSLVLILDMEMFSILVKEVTALSSSKFFSLRSLKLNAPTTEANNVLLAILLNSCSASLTALTITVFSNGSFGRIVIPMIDPLLWLRLEEFRFMGTGTFTPSNGLCNVLALCPNLRAFEVSDAAVTATEFLSTQFTCGHSLVSFALIACGDRAQILQSPQPPPWLGLNNSFTTQEGHMATMAQFELPTPMPMPAQPQQPQQQPQLGQVPPWLQYPSAPPCILAAQTSQLTTLARFEPPAPFHHHLFARPPPQPPAPDLPVFAPFFPPTNPYSIHNYYLQPHTPQLSAAETEEFNAHSTKVCLRIISEFPHLKQLEYGASFDNGTSLFFLYPREPPGKNEDCVEMFREGLPGLRSLVVRGVSCL